MASRSEKIGYIRHFEACNRYDIAHFVPFYIGVQKLGWVTKALAKKLSTDLDTFEAYKDGIALASRFTNFKTRSEALAEAVAWIARRSGEKVRDEMYAVKGNWEEEPVAQISRSAMPWFGMRAFGVHINGFTRKGNGIHLWIGERAADRGVDPGKLDNMVGGGLPFGLTVKENLRKEAEEEAGIDTELANKSKHARTLGYVCQRPEGLRNDTLFIYDLELPKNFQPENRDGEVARFLSMPIEEVAEKVRATDEFKFNCNLVLIDFLVRHGAITEKHPEHKALMAYLKPERPPNIVLMSSGDTPST